MRSSCFLLTCCTPDTPTTHNTTHTTRSYSPLPAAALSKLAECKEQLVDLLHSLPGMFTPGAAGPDSCGAAAMEVSLLLAALLRSVP